MGFEQVKTAVNRMNTEFRRPGIDALCISDSYDLKKHWPEEYWPNNLLPGVYMFFDEEDHLLYVGKAIGALGRRISAYFNHGDDGSAKPTSAKSEGVRYVRTIGQKERHEFEAAAVESFLIRELRPPRNERS